MQSGSEAEPVPNANCGQDLLSNGRSIPLGDETERLFMLHLALITSHLALNSVTEPSPSKYSQ